MASRKTIGEFEISRSDVFYVDPRALTVDWAKNISRGGIEPPVDESLTDMALDMMPKSGQGDTEEGSSGQLNPILCRLVGPNLEVVGGFRRLRAALWLIESGNCPDFKVKYTVTRMTAVESALVNAAENIHRSDPNPIQLGYMVRSFTEDYGLSMKVVAGRLKKSPAWLGSLLNLVSLPHVIQASVARGETPVSAALELAKLPSGEQSAAFQELAENGKVTAGKVREKRQASSQDAGEERYRPRSMKEFLAYLDSRANPNKDAYNFAVDLKLFLGGKLNESEMDDSWDRLFLGDIDHLQESDEEIV